MMSQQDPPPGGGEVSPDWRAVHASVPFQELVTRRGSFVRAAATAVLGWFAVFLLVVGAAPDLAGQVVVAGMTVGFLLGLSQFLLAWFLTWRYLRLSATVFSGLEAAALAAATPAVTGEVHA
ncbi:DUF485 domain-containing protein [Pseudonocardia acidicola]|uniref:DUF485 domain-containing protein n=1 Tax=Pseudonocardia acidicola TaxID=2724939 RepID=A0ABX1SI69_9PSEU|nr:DUF485 domain-containing protein [Pseudonocardia acidicola]NMH99868.1 DUF485 domain-containing protein [Pseudonocardia acidicola]